MPEVTCSRCYTTGTKSVLIFCPIYHGQDFLHFFSLVIVKIIYSFLSIMFCCSLNVHPDVRDIIAVGKTLECFRLATLKLKERCLVLKSFFKKLYWLLTSSQFIKQFTELLHTIILLTNKCSFETINIRQ